MGLKLEVGKTYSTHDGENVNVLYDDGTNPYPFKCSDGRWRTRDGRVWEDGARSPDDLIAEWTAPTGPVRTVTRTTREIVYGVHGDVEIVEDDTHQGGIGIYINATMNAARIRAAASNMIAVADAMEEQP